MSGFLDHLGPEAIRESALLILAVVIAALVLLALAFGVYTFLLRLRNERRAVRWQRLEGAWQEPLLAALDDPEKIAEVQAAVGEKDRLHFVRFVLDYARRVRGRERAVLRELVQPCELEASTGRSGPERSRRSERSDFRASPTTWSRRSTTPLRSWRWSPRVRSRTKSIRSTPGRY